jgi:hypothetical protein
MTVANGLPAFRFAFALKFLAVGFWLAIAGIAAVGQSQPGSESQVFGSYVWTAPIPGGSHALGTVSFDAGSGSSGSGSSAVQVLAPDISSAAGVLNVSEAAWNTAGGSPQLQVTVESGGEPGGTPVHITVTPSVTKGRLQASVTADKPGITLLDLGNWPYGLKAQLIAVPYYTNTVAYLPSIKAYANAWLNWHTTGSSQVTDTQATYLPLTDGKLHALNEQFTLVVSPAIGDVFPSPQNRVSPYLNTMSGRMIVDVWSGSFDAIAQRLGKLGSYGVTNCLVIIHNWQHHGYDNALPDHYPANPALGGDAGLKSATEEARAIGCLVAVHENYIDYYPNYDHFNPASIALNSDGTRQDSWLNPDTGIQSFAAKPNWVIKNASTESPFIHERYGTTASFLDVLSAVGPGFHVDMDATQPGAGKVTARDLSSASLWAYLRQTHQGPVVGEGVNHWYNSGLLDGVEAQTGAGAVASNLGPLVPLFVNFDLDDMHPFQVNHGMGYVNRWTRGYGAFTATSQRDAYRMQEIAFGHAPFLDDSDFGDASRAMTESALVSPVAGRYGAVTAETISYKVDGAWVSASQAALTGAFHQVQVTYRNGLTVTANDATEPLRVKGLTLPQYGWSATGDGVTAFTALCGDVICDYAQTDESIFANARNQSDIRIGGALAGPSVSAFHRTGAYAFNISYDWKVYDTTALNLIAFVHFVDPSQTTNEGIVFQGDYSPTVPTSEWQPGQVIAQGPNVVKIPASVPDGTYSVRVGLYDPTSGDRYPLAGQNDGDERYIVGSVTIANHGTKIQFTQVSSQANDPRLNAAGSVLNFPAVQTDGMFSLNQENGNWVLRPFPRFRNFTILVRSAVVAMPGAVTATGGTSLTVTPLNKGSYWKLPLNGASSYSWPVE